MKEVVEECCNNGEEDDEQEELDENPDLDILRRSSFRWFAYILTSNC